MNMSEQSNARIAAARRTLWHPLWHLIVIGTLMLASLVLIVVNRLDRSMDPAVSSLSIWLSSTATILIVAWAWQGQRTFDTRAASTPTSSNPS